MNEHALQNITAIAKSGNPNPKSFARREQVPAKFKIVTEGAPSTGSGTVRLSSVPGYDAARRQAELLNVQARTSTAPRYEPRRGPSDGRVCWNCGGDHYARDCRWRRREPYWGVCKVFPLLEATTKLLEATPSWQLYHSSAWSSEFSLKHYELKGCGYVDSSPQKPLARQTLYIAKPFFNDKDAWMLKQWGTKVLDHWTKRGVLKIPCNISLISWVKSWE